MSEQDGLRIAGLQVLSSRGPIYRGFRVRLPREMMEQIDSLLAMPMEESQIGRSKGIGQIIVRWLEANHPNYDDYGGHKTLGRHWTTRKDWADKAAMQGGVGNVGIILEATYDESGVDHEHTLSGGYHESEDEVTLLPGAKVTITGVDLTNYYGADNMDLLDAPIRSMAASFSPSMCASWESTRPWDVSREDFEMDRIPGIRSGNARGSEDASFEGGKIVVKPQWFTRPSDARKAILYHEAGHALEERTGLDGLRSARHCDLAGRPDPLGDQLQRGPGRGVLDALDEPGVVPRSGRGDQRPGRAHGLGRGLSGAERNTHRHSREKGLTLAS